MITIVLLNCSINLLASNRESGTNLLTGGVVEQSDSVLIAYSDLKLANKKLMELTYEKKINANLRTIIANDSIVIKDYKIITDRLNKDCKKAIRQRNIAIGAGVILFITSVILLVK